MTEHFRTNVGAESRCEVEGKDLRDQLSKSGRIHQSKNKDFYLMKAKHLRESINKLLLEGVDRFYLEIFFSHYLHWAGELRTC